eukprot:6193828-Pleurochrysis_carterae.AAC.1
MRPRDHEAASVLRRAANARALFSRARKLTLSRAGIGRRCVCTAGITSELESIIRELNNIEHEYPQHEARLARMLPGVCRNLNDCALKENGRGGFRCLTCFSRGGRAERKSPPNFLTTVPIVLGSSSECVSASGFLRTKAFPFFPELLESERGYVCMRARLRLRLH